MTLGSTSDDGMSLSHSVTWKLVLIIVLGGLIRVASLSDIGIDHFDAGAYAESAAAHRDSSSALFPRQHFLSPPVFFSLAGWLAGATGLPIDESLSWVSALLGTLTVLVVFLLGRVWLSNRAGLFAAAVIGLSAHHTVLSRCGLTDAAFCAFFLLALLAHSIAHRRDSWWLAVVAGIAVGVAWNTKYHGWLAGVIAAAATTPDFIRGSRIVRWRIFGRHGIATLVAMACYAPWFLHICQMEGGYGALAAEHRRFLSDAGRFLAHAGRHLESWRFFDAPMAHLGFLGGLLVIADGRGVRRAFLIVTLFGLSFFVSTAAVVLALALLGSITALRDGTWRQRAWPLAFFGLFCVLTPLYRPYNRLAMPLILAAAILAPTGVRFLEQALRAKLKLTGAILLAIATFHGVTFDREAKPAATIYGDTAGMRDAAQRIAVLLQDEGVQGAVYVVGEPPIVHYLREADIDARAVDELGSVTKRPMTFIMGIYAMRTPVNRAFLEANRERVTGMFDESVRVSDIRLLDDFNPTEARAIRASEERPHRLRVYRLN